MQRTDWIFISPSNSWLLIISADLDHIIVNGRYSPKNLYTIAICWANSLVGARTNVWTSLIEVSITWRVPIAKVAVLPVPDWACAIVSLPWIIGKIAFCWIGDGFSNP